MKYTKWSLKESKQSIIVLTDAMMSYASILEKGNIFPLLKETILQSFQFKTIHKWNEFRELIEDPGYKYCTN